MNINKTADECIAELRIALLQCLGDSQLSLEEKQGATKWIAAFLNYQDALNKKDEAKIDFYQQQLNKMFCPNYYKNALQEFKNANILYKNIHTINKLNLAIIDYATNQTILATNNFCDAFLNTLKKYQLFINDYDLIINKQFIDSFKLLIFTIHYHLSYSFKNELLTTLEILTKILKNKIKVNKQENNDKEEKLLINMIISENKKLFNSTPQINLINFINRLDEIFNYESGSINKKIMSLVFKKPKRLVITMNTILKKHNIFLYQEIWENEKINHKKSNMLMNLFAYETYFLQGHNHQQIYEDLILKKVIVNEKYWFIFQEYKIKNKIDQKIKHSNLC